MGISVAGGEDGRTAVLEDLATMARLLRETADTLTTASHAAAFGRLEIGGCSGLDLGRDANAALDDVLAGLCGPATSTVRTARELDDLAQLVSAAMRCYAEVDDGVGGMVLGALLAAPRALFEAQLTFQLTGNPVAAAQHLVTADPELTDAFAQVTHAQALTAAGSAYVTDGHAVVTDAAVDVAPAAVDAPRSVADLIRSLSLRNGGAPGEVSVSFVFGADGVRRAIVDIPGTKSWTPAHTADVTSLATNLRAITGARTTYEDGVLEAMRRAGVTSTDPVMLVGHSEGGMIAVNAARDARAAGSFQVTHVVTAGSPIGHTVGAVPDVVQVLALEGRHDLVPHLDGAANTARRNVTTVTGGADHGSIGANHGLDSGYEPLARAVDASGNGSVRAFLDSARGFLTQPYMTTQRYVVTRQY